MKAQILNVTSMVENVLGNYYPSRCYAAGGCIRDLWHGVPYKDIDVVVPIGDGDDKGVFSLMEQFARNFRFIYNVPVAITMAYTQSAEGRTSLGDFDERLYGVVKLNTDWGDVDVLFSRYPTIEAVLDFFDCNLNQGYMGTDGVVHYTPPSELVWLKPVAPERKQRMLNKWEALYD